MAFEPRPGERYTIRRKILTIFGASFHIFDEHGSVVGFCRQRAFKLREDIRVFTGEDRRDELIRMRARSIIDFGTTYDVTLPSGQVIGSLRRKGLRSMVRDSWLVFDEQGRQIATLEEDSGGKAFARRILPLADVLMPQTFHLTRDADGARLATLRTHFNLFVYRLGIAVHAEDEVIDDLLVLATGCLIAAIEGRQSSDSGGAIFSGD